MRTFGQVPYRGMALVRNLCYNGSERGGGRARRLGAGDPYSVTPTESYGVVPQHDTVAPTLTLSSPMLKGMGGTYTTRTDDNG